MGGAEGAWAKAEIANPTNAMPTKSGFIDSILCGGTRTLQTGRRKFTPSNAWHIRENVKYLSKLGSAGREATLYPSQPGGARSGAGVGTVELEQLPSLHPGRARTSSREPGAESRNGRPRDRRIR